MNRRVTGIIAAAVLAVIGTIILVTFVRDAEDRALEGEEVVEVLVFTDGVPAGTAADDLGSVTELERIPRKLVAPDAVADLSQLAGLVTAVDLVEREQVRAVRFVTPERFAPARGSIEVPEGLVEATISVGPAQTVGSVLRPGDRVAIVATFEGTAAVPDGSEEVGSATAGLLMQQVLVTNVQGDPLAVPESTDPTGRAPSPNSGLLVTVAVTPNEFERLAFVSAFGAFHLALQTDDDPIVDVNVQTGQIIYGAPESG